MVFMYTFYMISMYLIIKQLNLRFWRFLFSLPHFLVLNLLPLRKTKGPLHPSVTPLFNFLSIPPQLPADGQDEEIINSIY